MVVGNLLVLGPNINKSYRSRLYSYFTEASRNPVTRDALALGQRPIENTEPELEVKRDGSVHGHGLFAGQDYQPGQYIIAVKGILKLKTDSQSAEEMAMTWDGPCEFVISQDSPTWHNCTRYLNSCRGTGRSANVEVVWESRGKVAYVKALGGLATAIQRGEELLADYNVS